MTKIILSALFAILSLSLNAQDIKKAKDYLKNKQLDKAKSEIDAYIIKNPAVPEGYYVKSKIYGDIAASEQFKTLDPQARTTALEAFKKAITLDTESKLMINLVQDNYSPIFNLYVNASEVAAKLFNDAVPTNDKEGFKNALNTYIQTYEIGQYIAANKYATIAVIDTPIILNIARSALYGDVKDATLKYSKMLADANISNYRGDKSGYDLPYKWLVSNYANAGDEANLMKYAAAGKKYFPGDPYFGDVLIEYYADAKKYKELFQAYDAVITQYPDSSKYHLQYAADLLTLVYTDSAGFDKTPYKQKFETEIALAMKGNPESIDGNLLYGHYYYNTGVDLQNESKAVKDAVKKAEKMRLAKESVKKSIPYFEKVIAYYESGLKKSERSKYKSLLNTMQDLYGFLDQKPQVAVYQQKYDTADTKFVK